MNVLTPDILTELKSIDQATCLSLYMPTHRTHPNNAQDPILYGNLLKRLQASLKSGQQADVEKMISPFEALADEKDFWDHTPGGLAVFGAKDYFRVVGIPERLPELAVVASSFHLKPLRKYLQSADRFQVLGLSLQDFQLYEGHRHEISPIPLEEDFPNTMKELLGEELTEEHLTVASYGGVGGNKGNMVHGHGGRKDELDVDAERFFRAAATLVYEKISKLSRLPLILAALPEHQGHFRRVNKNPFLVQGGINVNPKSVEPDRLAQMAWEVMEPDYNNNIRLLSERFQEAQAQGKGSADLSTVARAAAEGRVEVLILEAEKIIPGKLNMETGAIEPGDLEHPEHDDLLDDIGELVSEKQGKVVVVQKELMPADTGLAAIFRF